MRRKNDSRDRIMNSDSATNSKRYACRFNGQKIAASVGCGSTTERSQNSRSERVTSIHDLWSTKVEKIYSVGCDLVNDFRNNLATLRVIKQDIELRMSLKEKEVPGLLQHRFYEIRAHYAQVSKFGSFSLAIGFRQSVTPKVRTKFWTR